MICCVAPLGLFYYLYNYLIAYAMGFVYHTPPGLYNCGYALRRHAAIAGLWRDMLAIYKMSKAISDYSIPYKV